MRNADVVEGLRGSCKKPRGPSAARVLPSQLASVDADRAEVERRKMMRSRARRILRVLAIVSVVLLSLIALALVVARAYFTDRRITEMVPAMLSKQLAGDFIAKEIRWRPPLSATIEGLVVQDPDGTEVIAARRIEATLAPLALLRKRVELDDVMADGLRVRLIPSP